MNTTNYGFESLKMLNCTQNILKFSHSFKNVSLRKKISKKIMSVMFIEGGKINTLSTLGSIPD